MILNLNTHFGIICPQCGTTLIQNLTAFDASKRTAHNVSCQCGHQMLTISLNKNNIYKITAACFVCGQTHEYKASLTDVFTKDKIEFICPYEGESSFCFGSEDEVNEWCRGAENEIEMYLESDDEFDDMGKYDPERVARLKEQLEAFNNIEDDENLKDFFRSLVEEQDAQAVLAQGINDNALVKQLIVEKLEQLINSDGLCCNCSSTDVKFKVYIDLVELSCTHCDTTKLIRFDNLQEVMILLNAESFVLGRQWVSKPRGKKDE